MRCGKYFLIILLIYIFPLFTAYAKYDPLAVQNNIYGIHIADFGNISSVAELVNSTNGDWGYVTVVLSDNNRNSSEWNKLFSSFRYHHLIPIVRLATHTRDGAWIIPNKDTIHENISFLNDLNWPTENRYIILFNEPNHAKEWGNTISPEQYADIAYSYIKEFHKSSEDFFIMLSGFDASAPNGNETMDEYQFVARLFKSKPELKDLIDGWVSHSYPNPGFSASPYTGGKGSVKTFEWELSYLSQLGITRTVPVFITETGWIHQTGKTFDSNLLSEEEVGRYILISASTIWSDPRIVAITPFIFDYQDGPFDHFSWRTIGGNDWYPFAQTYRQIPKIQGKPLQREEYRVENASFPSRMVVNTTLHKSLMLVNSGQAYIDPFRDQNLKLSTDIPGFNIQTITIPSIDSGHKGFVNYTITSPKTTGIYEVPIYLERNSKRFLLSQFSITLIEPPRLQISIKLGYSHITNANEVKVIIYDTDDHVIEEFHSLSCVSGIITTPNIKNINPERTYRIVVIVPYYLPRQMIAKIGNETTILSMPRFWPFDLDKDGTFTWKDIRGVFSISPHVFIQKMLPL